MNEKRVKEILDYIPGDLKDILRIALDLTYDTLEELRIRINKPLIVSLSAGNFFISSDGYLTSDIDNTYIVSASKVNQIFQSICENSIYAYLEEIKQGFITIRGGHRVGFVGRAIVNNDKIENFRDIGSINIRIAREVIGSADGIINRVIDKDGKVKNTLLVAPPMVGKTTVLRDIARQLSNKGLKTGITDDRGEIAAMFRGIPQNDIGIQSDVVENAPKSEAITIMLRSMSPQVIISDEIARESDVYAVLQAFGTGVSVIGTAHAGTFEEVLEREFLKPLFREYGFKQVIILKRQGIGKNVKLDFDIHEISADSGLR